ncbi:MAG: MBL fold metallo-hydrolase [Methanomassiliicoccales archaeon]|nr:MBL fold metallo-hydrolase [Methanomassiliicoccales archaeon]
MKRSRDSRRFIAQHGFSLLIETPDEERVIFDTGPSPVIISQNLELLGLEPADLNLVFISHGHRDHAGGLAPFIEAGIPVHCAPDTFMGERFVENDGKLVTVSCDTELLESINSHGFIASNDFRELVPGIHASGLVPRNPEFENTCPFWKKEGGAFVKDRILDEQSLYLDTEAGVVVICGCSHAGVLNVVAHARKLIDRKIILLMGGFHLGGASLETLLKTADALRKEGVKHIAPMHCSGFEAMRVFSDIFEHFELMGVGDAIQVDQI